MFPNIGRDFLKVDSYHNILIETVLLTLLKTYTGIDVWKDVERFINWSHLTFSNMYMYVLHYINIIFKVQLLSKLNFITFQ